ncbi:SDR family NAD(P)-dependent oxidoreductase [Ottowia sp.]|uniref:SDR family NAD(P)-dependent oxidoreductase n=1 Tax=Ottowia sp. TaxID=1898956 RepID=UPI0025D1FC04|nr:SDR family NAD(P)-dependent oxidoreductase [Ottowia sp.]MBK6616645.1 SDR family NAD(P)-dependent oxidoreductase [Ottowia sp.]
MSAPAILITGASSGIGLASAIRLRAAGWQVIATVRDSTSADVLTAHGIEPVLLDLSSPSDAERAARELVAKHPRLDAVFLNAGYAAAGAIEDLGVETWHRQFQVNVFGHLQVLQVLLREDVLGSGARVVWCSSVLAIAGMPMRGAYSASKAAIESIADVQRLELAHRGIAVSILQPGPIITKFRSNSLASLRATVDVSASRYARAYEATIRRLAKPGAVSPGTLPPEAVAETLLTCLAARQPRPRYAITRNTKLMFWLSRLLSSNKLDFVLRRAAGEEVLPVPADTR